MASLFSDYNKLNMLSKMGDPWEKLSSRIDWEKFRQPIENCFKETDPEKGGRPPFDRVMMFKILILQRYYDLSDDTIEYQINDRLTFMRFLGLTLDDKVPDAKTIWLFRETLIQKRILENLFISFNENLKRLGMIVNKGKIADATITEKPIDRNTREENKEIKAGRKPEVWDKNKTRQKDMDARWTKKNGKSYYGYKNHILVDVKGKIITDYVVTPANVSDSEIGKDLLDGVFRDEEFYGDRGYPSEDINQMMQTKGVIDKVMRRGAKHVKLGEQDEERNKSISKIRCRVEHAFGFIKRNHCKYLIRSIGIDRAMGQITLMNLTYNLFRAVRLSDQMKLDLKLGI